jgi:uncharacterized protein (TIGR02145 family)
MKTLKIILTIASLFTGIVANAQNLTWMNTNLNTSQFSNGENIPQAKSVAEWQAACKAKKPIWCYLKFNPANGPKYGKIYNYFAVIDKRGLAPKGWHIASESDFDLFEKSLESHENSYGGKEYHFPSEFTQVFSGYFNGYIFDLFEGSILGGKWWTSSTRVINTNMNYSTNTYNTEKQRLVYEFNQTYSGYHIDQDIRKDWSNHFDNGNSVRCVADKKKEIESKEEELKSKNNNKVQTKSRQTKGNYVIGVKEKIYFYKSPDYGTKTSAYFVKGQKAKIVEIMDENLDNEFLHVNFEYKGKVTDRYILYEDVKFE